MPNQHFFTLLCGLLALSLTACGGSASSGSLLRDLVGQQNRSGDWVEGLFLPSSDFRHYCENPRSGSQVFDRQGSYVDENNWLRSWNRETYLWYNESPDIDPATTSAPPSYHRQLGRPGDSFRWSEPTEEYRRLVESGESAGYGIRWTLLRASPPRDIRVAYVEPGSPADAAGVVRGARVERINNRDAVNGDNVELLNAGLYPEASGDQFDFRFQLPDGETLSTNLTAENITVSPVQTRTVIERPSGHIGYIHFTRHIRPAEAALSNAIQSLSQDGVSDLVIDLRYNGGGFLYIASQLAYMVAGPEATQGKTFEVMQFNDQHPDTNPITGDTIQPEPFLNRDRETGASLPSLDLERIVVITGSNTCSASEAFINGLRGIDVDVIQIGAATCGKPYGGYTTDNCGTSYFMPQFKGVNHLGYGDYTEGFYPVLNAGSDPAGLPGCQVADDFSHALGDSQEARLAAAIHYLEEGECPVSSMAQLQAAPGEALPSGVHIEPSDAGAVRPPPEINDRLMR